MRIKKALGNNRTPGGRRTLRLVRERLGANDPDILVRIITIEKRFVKAGHGPCCRLSTSHFFQSDFTSLNLFTNSTDGSAHREVIVSNKTGQRRFPDFSLFSKKHFNYAAVTQANAVVSPAQNVPSFSVCHLLACSSNFVRIVMLVRLVVTVNSFDLEQALRYPIRRVLRSVEND